MSINISNLLNSIHSNALSGNLAAVRNIVRKAMADEDLVEIDGPDGNPNFQDDVMRGPRERGPNLPMSGGGTTITAAEYSNFATQVQGLARPIHRS
jgi:hypothetical protein